MFQTETSGLCFREDPHQFWWPKVMVQYLHLLDPGQISHGIFGDDDGWHGWPMNMMNMMNKAFKSSLKISHSLDPHLKSFPELWQLWPSEPKIHGVFGEFLRIPHPWSINPIRSSSTRGVCGDEGCKWWQLLQLFQGNLMMTPLKLLRSGNHSKLKIGT